MDIPFACTRLPARCALPAWREIDDGPSGPLSRRIHGRATVGERLTDRNVALIVKASVERIGLVPADRQES